jgi:hypothetical protein
MTDLVQKVSPEGRMWTFGYDTLGDLMSVTGGDWPHLSARHAVGWFGRGGPV